MPILTIFHYEILNNNIFIGFIAPKYLGIWNGVNFYPFLKELFHFFLFAPITKNRRFDEAEDLVKPLYVS